MKKVVYIAVLISLVSCSKDEALSGKKVIIENFESYNINEEFTSSSGDNWTFFQQTEFENTIELDTVIVFEGDKSAKFFAKKTENGNASKCDIANNKMSFPEGETFQFSAWYFIEGNQPVDYIFLFDLEETVPVGVGPGMRVSISPDNQIILERNKMGMETIYQQAGSEIEVPRDQWFFLDLEVLLSLKEDGFIKIKQNGEQIIFADNQRTLPKDRLTFTQGTKGVYTSVQVGITANSALNDVTLYVDDIRIQSLQ